MAFAIRPGNWLTKRFVPFADDPDPGGFSRLEILVAGPDVCRVHVEAALVSTLKRTSLLLEWWRPFRPRKCVHPLPLWVRPGNELVWRRWSFSGGRSWFTDIPVHVGRIRSGWFTTFNVGEEDGRLWFWSADHLAEHPDTFRPARALARFERDMTL